MLGGQDWVYDLAVPKCRAAAVDAVLQPLALLCIECGEYDAADRIDQEGAALLDADAWVLLLEELTEFGIAAIGHAADRRAQHLATLACKSRGLQGTALERVWELTELSRSAVVCASPVE